MASRSELTVEQASGRPGTLPADFGEWDGGEAPELLPADFDEFDSIPDTPAAIAPFAQEAVTQSAAEEERAVQDGESAEVIGVGARVQNEQSSPLESEAAENDARQDSAPRLFSAIGERRRWWRRRA